MNAATPDVNSATEDIDLLLLLERSILFFRKYRILFVIAGLLGVGLGIFGFLTLPKIYTSRMVAHSFVLTNPEHIQIIENWNKLLKRHEYAALAQTLNCPEKILYKLKKIEGTEIQKVFSPSNPSGFYVDVNVTDNSILEELQKGIVYGLENGNYVKQRLAYKKARLKELIEKLGTEVVKLDSNKSEVENIINGKEKTSSSLIIDGSSINRQWIDMNEKLLFFQEELNFTNGIQVYQGFSKFEKPIGPKLIVLIVLGLILFLSIAYIYALFDSIKRKLKARSLSGKN